MCYILIMNHWVVLIKNEVKYCKLIWKDIYTIGSVKLLIRIQLLLNAWTAAHQASLSITNSQSLFKLMSIKSVMPFNHLILCHPLLLLPSTFPSIRVFSRESVLGIRWPKYWSFSFSISPSNEYSELISFRMDWLDLLAVQGIHRVFSNTIAQKHHSLALSFPYSPTLTFVHDYWKNQGSFVDKVMSLLFNMLSRLVIAFLPRRKCLLISWLQPPYAVILEPPK